MKLTSKGKREVAEVTFGVYLWKMPDGKFVGDGEGHFLMIQAMEGDQQKLRLLADAARSYGIDEGMPCFFRGNRIVTDEEYEEQKQRLNWGLTPDKYDIASVLEDKKNAHRNRR